MSKTKDTNEAAGGGSALTAMLEVLVEPMAWMTYDIHGAQMVWTDYEEACVYCDDDEQPIPLYKPSNVERNRPAGGLPPEGPVDGSVGRHLNGR